MSEFPTLSTQFLVVDDYAFVRKIVSQHLKSCGFDRIDFAQNGAEALSLLSLPAAGHGSIAFADIIGTRPDIAEDLALTRRSTGYSHPHCVITDFGMPKGNGLQLLKWIRCGQTSVPRNTPVILLTGYSDDYVIAAALQLDVNAIVAKPVSRNTLREKVERVLKSDSPIHDIPTYESVNIPDEAGKTILVEAETTDPVEIPRGTEMDNILWVALSAVPCGAVLAADLRGERGALLLRRGAVFSESVLHKLLDIKRMHGLDGKIPIVIAS